MAKESDRAFAGSIPQLYEQLMVPMIFEPYAQDLARRVARFEPARVLELAAGTGVVTRHLARTLAPTTSIVATDLNQPMLDHAAALGTSRPVQWRQADAQQLPFADGEFDVVACQFGAMFFPDKAGAYAEARRVLRPGGILIFNVWDRVETNDFARVVGEALTALFPADPPRFMERVPHGYYDTAVIADHVKRGGFDAAPEVTTLPARSRAASARVAATAYCQGTPWRAEIESRGPTALEQATERAAAALEAKFGTGEIEGGIQAHVVAVRR